MRAPCDMSPRSSRGSGANGCAVGGGGGGGGGGGAGGSVAAGASMAGGGRGGGGGGEQKGDDGSTSSDSFQSLAMVLTKMQETMQCMNARMKKTDQAVRGVGQRLNMHGRIMNKIQKRMNVLERTLKHSSDAQDGPAAGGGGGGGPGGSAYAADRPSPAGEHGAYGSRSARYPSRVRSSVGGARSLSCGGPCLPAPASVTPLSQRLSRHRSASFGGVCTNRLFSPSPTRGPPACAMFGARTAGSCLQRTLSSTGGPHTSDVRFSSPPASRVARDFAPRSVSSTGSLYGHRGARSVSPPPGGRTLPVPRSLSSTGPPSPLAHGRSHSRSGGTHRGGAQQQSQPHSQTSTHASRLLSLGKNLLNAAQEGRSAAVRNLLDAGADPNFTYGSEWTPLHRAAAKSHADVVSMLLKRGGDVNARTSGFTALHMAAYYDLSGRCVQLLIDAGSDLNSGNQFWRTPLHYASESGNDAAVRALLTAGARRNAKDHEGKTPLDVAKTHCVRRLLALYCNRPAAAHASAP